MTVPSSAVNLPSFGLAPCFSKLSMFDSLKPVPVTVKALLRRVADACVVVGAAACAVVPLVAGCAAAAAAFRFFEGAAAGAGVVAVGVAVVVVARDALLLSSFSTWRFAALGSSVDAFLRPLEPLARGASALPFVACRDCFFDSCSFLSG